MHCNVCASNETTITYKGAIRNGSPGNMMTVEDVSIYKCSNCGCIWHDPVADSVSLYQSDDYRSSMGEDVSLGDFYKKHDSEILNKLNYTGTEVYRDKLCMDLGCGGGGYADYISGTARKVVLIEPNRTFSRLLQEKGYEVFPYAEDALYTYENQIEILTTYDVIEHTDDPKGFLKTIFRLLAVGGEAFIGTPTEYPVLRSLLGDAFDSFVFSVQHPWVFSRKSLEIMAKNCGFSQYSVGFYQRFGIGNMLAWLQTKKPCGDKQYGFVTESLDALYKSEMAREETAEYLILHVRK